MSIDGKIALPTKKPVKLSSLEDFRRVHELRNYCDGILVGINTILIDDPKLTVKSEFVMKPKNPIRIVLDTHGETPKSANILDGSAPTIIVMGVKYKNSGKEFKNAEIIYCPTIDQDKIDLSNLSKELMKRDILNLLVEGGETVIFSFIKAGLVDELSVYVSSKIIGGEASPTMAGGDGFEIEDDLKEFRLLSAERLGDGILLKYLPDY
jgi:2,5-diamino-6-(ribosylamino)-4(3H)-pyrimidinone 5'-phosphate reductase